MIIKYVIPFLSTAKIAEEHPFSGFIAGKRGTRGVFTEGSGGYIFMC
jgi:hypothetical protein